MTFQYKTTTTFKQLSTTLPERGTKKINDAVKGLATHVVTGILYGANAFFVFDSEKLDASSVQEIQGSMEAVIKKIPSFELKGNVNIKLSDKEKAVTDKFTCKFYGDFILDNNPSTFEDAVRTYQQIPKLLRENGFKGVPLKVWLMPLKNLDSEAAELKHMVSVGLVRKAQETLEDCRQMEMRCNDCLDDIAVSGLPPIRQKMSTFQKLCKGYKETIQDHMAKKIPLIRAGEEDESSLKQFFEVRDKSPFSHENLHKWMDHLEREVNIIRSCVKAMKGIKVVPSQSELDKVAFSPDVDDVLCFVFTSLETGDPYLQQLTDFLDSPKVQNTVDVTPLLQDKWCFSVEVIIKMKEKAKAFSDFANAEKNNGRMSFLVATTKNDKHKGASVYHYSNAILVSDDFSKPAVPDVKNVTERRALMWCKSFYIRLYQKYALNHLVKIKWLKS